MLDWAVKIKEKHLHTYLHSGIHLYGVNTNEERKCQLHVDFYRTDLWDVYVQQQETFRVAHFILLPNLYLLYYFWGTKKLGLSITNP